VGSDDGVFREAKSKEFFEKVFHVIGSVRVDRKGMVTGNASQAVTQQRNAQVHLLQNFAAGFRSQAKTTGSASIVGVRHPTVD
jgi:phage gp45-like